VVTPRASHTAEGRPRNVLLFVSPVRRARYPVGTVIAADGSYLRYQEAEASPPVATPSAMVVDGADDAMWQDVGEQVPLVVSTSDIARLAAGAGPVKGLKGRQWIPFAPAACAPDVVTAAGLVGEGRIGTPRVLQVTATVAPTPTGWERDHASGADLLEALVFAMQVTEAMLGEEVRSCRRVGSQAMPHAFEHETPSDILVQSLVCPAAYSRAPGIRAELYGSSGRLLLRPEFAPGALGLHTAEGFDFPAVLAAKSNIQSPDTVQGGWEGVEVVRTVMQDRRKSEVLRRQAERLIGLAAPMTVSEGELP
jgi:hypothetical protein